MASSQLSYTGLDALLTPEECVLILIDHQAFQFANLHSHDPQFIVGNVIALDDASASWSKYGDDLALRRMNKAGAIITTVDQIISELAIDWTSPNGNKLRGILDYH
jgi:hypothetical protein